MGCCGLLLGAVLAAGAVQDRRPGPRVERPKPKIGKVQIPTINSVEDFPDPAPQMREKVREFIQEAARKASSEDRPPGGGRLSIPPGNTQIYLVAELFASEEHARIILEALRRSADDSALPYLAAILGKVSDETKIPILYILGERGFEEAADLAAEYLGSDKPDLCAASIEALAGMGVIEHLETMVQLLDSPNQILHHRVSAALEKFGRKPETKEIAEGEILHHLQTSRSTRLLVRLLDIVAALRSAKAKGDVLRLMSHETFQVRLAAIAALVEIKPKNFIAKLGERLQIEPEGRVRSRLIKALEATRETEALPHLIRALADPDPLTRAAASYSLTLITGEAYGEDAEKWEAWTKSSTNGVPK